MRAVKSVSIDSERRVIITFLDGSTETLYPNCIWCDSEALRQLIKDLLEEKADAIVQTINNVTVATFEDGADEALIRKLLVNIDLVQEGSGYPSPENIRPIIGRTGLTVYKRGTNLVNDSIKAINTPGTTLYVGGEVNAYVHYLKAGTYTLSCDFADGVHYGANIKEINSDQITIWSTASDINQATFTLQKNGFYRLEFYQAASSGGVSVDGVSNVMLNYGETALPYEAYNQGENVPVMWQSEAGTVYAGTLDVVSGKLTVMHEGKLLNGSEDWTRVSGNYYYARLKIKDGRYVVSNVGICDRFPRVTIASTTNNQGFNVYYSSGVDASFIGIRYDAVFSGSEMDQLKTWLSQNNTTVVYQLAEPREIQLTPKEITTLLGVNNIWVDSGNILELEYVADTKLYIGESQSGTLGSSRQTISNLDLHPVSEKTWEDVSEAYKTETAEKETED